MSGEMKCKLRLMQFAKAQTVQKNQNQNQFSVLDALKIVAPILPIPVYWHDRDSRVLGINDLCLKGMGTTAENVIGKTPYDFYPKNTADHIVNHHKLVMQTGQLLSQEEFINNITTGQPVYAKAVKVPHTDEELAEALPRMRRGRPLAATTKERITIRLTRSVVDQFRSTGDGWQTRLDAALQDWLKDHRPAR